MKPPVPRLVIVFELDGNALPGGTLQLIIDSRSNRCREEFPVTSPDHLVALKTVQFLSLAIDISNPPIFIEGEKTVCDTFEHVENFVARGFCLRAKRTFTLQSAPPCERHLNMGTYPGLQFIRGERLNQVIVSTGLQTFHTHLFTGPC